MQKTILSFLLIVLIAACSNNKNLAQTPKTMRAENTLIVNINKSGKDTEAINAQLKKLQADNDMMIAFASLNYAWIRKGTYYVLASKNNSWKFYSYQATLRPSSNEEAAELSPIEIDTEAAENITQLYTNAALWNVKGDEDGNRCSGQKSCTINDAETWTISAATPQNIHTTTYYAPQFFEECCPGNEHRKQFIAIAKLMMSIGGNKTSGAVR